MKKSNRVLIAMCVAITLAFVFSLGTHAQNVVRKGKNFTEQSTNTNGGGATKSEYTYTNKDGSVDTIYISKSGSCFVWKTSKTTGKKYRKYLPAVTEELGTKKKDEK